MKCLIISLCMALPCTAAAQQVFPTPERAAQAFVEALSGTQADPQRLAELLGPQWRSFIPREGVPRKDVEAFVQQYRQQHVIERPSEHKALIAVGSAHWTLPIPIVKVDSGWRFDLQAGSAEVRARRIGRNELAAMQSLLAYHDAQMDFASMAPEGVGAPAYARKIFSSPGKHDGLYWPADQSGQVSPLGPLFGNAIAGEDWHGYHFRILEGQGHSAPGGAYSYLIGDRMSRGFAMIAWPATYADTGVMSFMISHDGQVFEKDLGPHGETWAKAVQRFDPDDSWAALANPAQPTSGSQPPGEVQ